MKRNRWSNKKKEVALDRGIKVKICNMGMIETYLDEMTRLSKRKAKKRYQYFDRAKKIERIRRNFFVWYLC